MNSEEYKNINARLDRIERLTLISAKNILDLEETAVLTGYSKDHLYRLTSQKQIPHFKKSKKLFFKKQDIEDWMTEDRVLTEAEINQQASTYTAIHKA